MTAGRELQVQAVLKGAIQQRGDSVVIDVELIHVGEDRRVWGNRYQGKLAERLTLQQQIVQEVPEKLRLTLTGQEKQILARLPTRNQKAHELYTLGRLAWNRRNQADLQQAIEHFEQAIQLDPNYALAHAGLADCHVVLPIYSRQSGTLAAAKVTDAAARALALDPTLAEPHFALAVIQARYHWDFVSAERGFQLALERKPNYATGRHWYGLFLSEMGRHDEAIRQLQLARQLDPNSLIIRVSLAKGLLFARKLDEAEAEARATLEEVPDFSPASALLGSACLYQQQYAEAVKFLREDWERDKNRPFATALLAYAYGVSGDAPRAREMLQELQGAAPRRHVSRLELAMVHLGLGAKEEALTLLEQAYRERDEDMLYINANPDFDSLRNEPRFQKIIADMKFPP
jgi:tetratricopeptide (TPR) repeat protein